MRPTIPIITFSPELLLLFSNLFTVVRMLQLLDPGILSEGLAKWLCERYVILQFGCLLRNYSHSLPVSFLLVHRFSTDMNRQSFIDNNTWFWALFSLCPLPYFRWYCCKELFSSACIIYFSKYNGLIIPFAGGTSLISMDNPCKKKRRIQWGPTDGTDFYFFF